jgi:LysM repeat protein
MHLISSARLLTLVCLSLGLASCENGQNPFTKSSSGGADPYVANYANDGGYNPYPGQPGTIAGGGPAAPTYEAPVAPVEADPYAFNAPSAKPKTSTSSSSSTPKKVVASSSKPRTSSSKSKSTAKKSGGSHKVVSGDSLYAIALKRKTTVAKLKAANGLKSDLIRPGQTLKIP